MGFIQHIRIKSFFKYKSTCERFRCSKSFVWILKRVNLVCLWIINPLESTNEKHLRFTAHMGIFSTKPSTSNNLWKRHIILFQRLKLIRINFCSDERQEQRKQRKKREISPNVKLFFFLIESLTGFLSFLLFAAVYFFIFLFSSSHALRLLIEITVEIKINEEKVFLIVFN